MSKPLINQVRKIAMTLMGVCGISALTALPAFSQQPPLNPANPNPPTNRIQPVPNQPTQDRKLIGGTNNYPYGTRIDSNGILSTPTGGKTPPRVSVPRGDGSTTYYYPDGSQINVQPSSVPPTGTLIR